MIRFDEFKRLAWSILVVGTLAFALGACEGDDGRDGAQGIAGTDGTDGTNGTDGNDGQDGQDGEDGEDGGNVEIASIHGLDFLLSTGEFEEADKFFANAVITSATADAAGVATVNFTVTDPRIPAGMPDGVPGITGMDFNIVALVPASGEESYNKWRPYIYRTETVAAPTEPHHDWMTATGTKAEQAYRESSGTFTDHGDGTYTYVFAADLSAAVTPVNNTPIPYDRSLTHRVSVMIGGHSGPTADANFDFVPDGSAMMTRAIVETATCQNCHGAFEFHGHGGDRLTVENCVTCHEPESFDAQSGETLDMKVMIHKIHAGGELASIPGFDGIVWDDPDTIADESADNGEYAIWGYQTSKHTWWKVGFPAVIENCTACHNGTGADVDNWKNVPSRAACGSCHDDIDFDTGVGHPVAVTDDNVCDACHAPSGTQYAIADAHDWTTKDQRNIPEFTVDMSVSDPANGTHFVAGESPIVTVVLSQNGTPIDHTTVVKDTDGKEGCADPLACPAADGKFDHAYLLVNGPRDNRGPALHSAAYAKVVSSTAGNFDLSAAVDIALKVDSGMDILLTTNGGQRLMGTIVVAVDPAAFVDAAAATPAEIVAWLNADSDFAARAIAYLEDGFVAIRSRNLGKFYAVQLLSSDVTTAVFGGDTSVHPVGGYYPRADLTIHADPADDDPKASWDINAITYALDPVDDLAPGTYTASVEITDRGRINGDDYKTPSVGWVTFEVGQAAEEKPPAGNCGMCHQGPDGRGFILDFSRHYKIFGNDAIDQCGACHDYQNGHDYGLWYGAQPISRRVHAIHRGSDLVYPNLTVGYVDPVKGRNWDITFPQYIKNCEACHAEGTTSGSWKYDAARLPCSGCHDADSTAAHLKLQTYDPTPADPWSGDEEESCMTCHETKE